MTILEVKEIARNLWKNQFYLIYGSLVVLFISSVAYVELRPASANMARKGAKTNSLPFNQMTTTLTNSSPTGDRIAR